LIGRDDPNFSSTSCTIQEKPATVPPVPVVKAAHANLGQIAQGLVVAGAQIPCCGGQSSAKRGGVAKKAGLGDLQELNGSLWSKPQHLMVDIGEAS